jgi:PAS domain S-box-containing protein
MTKPPDSSDSNQAILSEFIFQHSSDALLVLTRSGNDELQCTEVNESASLLLGYRRSEIKNRPLHSILSEASVRLLTERMGNTHHDPEMELTTARRKKIFVRMQQVPLNAGRKAVSALLLQDLTKKSEMEARMQQLDKLEALGQLAGSIAHDFNNVLAGIIGIGELGLRSMSETDYGFGILKKIISKADEASSLVRQLMVFNRNKSFKPRKLNLNPIIKSNYQFLERYLGDNIILEINLEEELFPVRSDITVIDQIIINLCINARDAMPDGGVLTIKTENIDIAEPVTSGKEWIPAGTYVQLSFEDNGVGMTDEIQTRIFEPFFTTKDIGYGTGLGMSIVFSLVKKHDAYISFDTTIGEGTCFRILFPAFLEKDSPALPEAEMNSGTGSETILIAENDPELLETFRRNVSSYGYEVLTARDGHQALTLFEKKKSDIDLILTDLVMPVFGGMELGFVARQIKPEIKILFMSSQNDRVEPGIPFLQKPFRAERLAKKIRMVMDDIEGKKPE